MGPSGEELPLLPVQTRDDFGMSNLQGADLRGVKLDASMWSSVTLIDALRLETGDLPPGWGLSPYTSSLIRDIRPAHGVKHGDPCVSCDHKCIEEVPEFIIDHLKEIISLSKKPKNEPSEEESTHHLPETPQSRARTIVRCFTEDGGITLKAPDWCFAFVNDHMELWGWDYLIPAARFISEMPAVDYVLPVGAHGWAEETSLKLKEEDLIEWLRADLTPRLAIVDEIARETKSTIGNIETLLRAAFVRYSERLFVDLVDALKPEESSS